MADLMPSKGFLTNKAGPLPVWAWMGLGLGGALAISAWNKNKAEAAADAAPMAANGKIHGQPLPANIVPQYTFVDNGVVNTHVYVPPLGGRAPDAPVTVPPPPPTVSPIRPTLPPIRINWPSLRLPSPPAAVPPPPPPPAGRWESIIPWGRNQGAGTPSTLWGLAEKVYGPGKGGLWQNIWNAPQNAALRNRRGDPRSIQPGDNFWVPL